MAMAALQGVSVLRGAAAASVKPTSQLLGLRSSNGSSSSRRAAGARSRTVAMASGATKGDRSYKLTVLPGDGIGPEIIKVAIDVLRLVGSQEGEDCTLVQLSSFSLLRCLNFSDHFSSPLLGDRVWEIGQQSAESFFGWHLEWIGNE